MRDHEPVRPSRVHPDGTRRPAGAGQRRGDGAAAPRDPEEFDRIGPAEAAFITERDHFYLASVTADGWPYVQHRGGPPGFVHVLDEGTLAYTEVRGNRQYITTGNLRDDDRVSLFFMDYPRYSG